MEDGFPENKVSTLALFPGFLPCRYFSSIFGQMKACSP
jgi:hypothetical protein